MDWMPDDDKNTCNVLAVMNKQFSVHFFDVLRVKKLLDAYLIEFEL